jgi:peroxiredoxin
MPGGLRYLKDREEGFYDFVSMVSPATTEAQLNHLVNSKDKITANWAKAESVWFAIRKAPFDLKFTELDAKGKGKEIDFNKLQGRVVYLYFWTTDTKGIVADIDKILDVYFDTSRRKFEVIGVCCDPEEKRAEALEFIRKNKIKWPQYFDGQGKDGELCKKFNVRGFPTGFIFETNGKLGPINIKSVALKNEVARRVR